MAHKVSRIASALTIAAALSMAATPAMARGFGGGFGGGWGGHRHHNRVDAGDVFAGIFILGTIAAVASAANKNKNERRNDDYRDRDYRDDDRNYQDRNSSARDDRSGNYTASRGIDGAVDTCVSEVERKDRRVDSVDTVGRDGDGWRVEGRVSTGRSFACSVNGEGRIRSVTVDGTAA